MSSGGRGSSLGHLLEASVSDPELAWKEREEEAHHLAALGFDSSALSLRMYSLEIRIKTLICRTLRLSHLPRVCKSHNLSELIIFTGLWEELENPANAGLRQNWD
jgi:hypothetical protein